MTRLSGRVPETGTAIENATVAILDTQGTEDPNQWSVVASTSTDANGEWSVSGLEPSAVERYHAVAQFDSGSEFVNFESLPYLSTPADAFPATTDINIDTPTASVKTRAFFDVAITSTDEPIVEGDNLNVDYFVENTGGVINNTQDIRLEVDNIEEDRDSNITISPSGSFNDTLVFNTVDGDAGTYNAVVLSDDDSASTNVTVESAIPDSEIYLHDDWGDNKLQNRDGGGTTTHNGVEGVYRPEWTIQSGSPSVSNGTLTTSTGQISTTCNLNDSEPITLEVTNFSVNGAGDNSAIYFWYQDADNRWQLTFGGDADEIQVVKRVSGAFTIVGTYATGDLVNRNVTVSRDNADSWSLTVDGTERDTWTDSFSPAANKFWINPFGGNSSTTEIDEIKLR
jgi:hypothetical protein